jgi:hypothetical protein
MNILFVVLILFTQTFSSSLFINSTGSDSTGCGSSLDLACLTFDKAWSSRNSTGCANSIFFTVCL